MKKHGYYLLLIVAAILVLSAYIVFQLGNNANLFNYIDISPVPTKEAEILDPPAPLVTYISTASGDVLISCIDKEGQILLGDIGPVSLFADNLPTNIPDMSLLSEYEASNASENNSDITPPLKLSAIKSNGEWNFFPYDIVYTEYELTSQPENEEWLAFFKKGLQVKDMTVPLLLLNLYRFLPTKQAFRLLQQVI